MSRTPPEDTRTTEPAWSPRKHVIAGFATLALVFGGFGSWAAFADLSGAVVARGQVEPAAATVTVRHPEGGTVRELFVSEGERIAVGAPLLAFDDTAVEQELSALALRIFEIRIRLARLRAERDGAPVLSLNAALEQEARDDPQRQAIIDGQRALLGTRARAWQQEADAWKRKGAQIAARAAGLEAQLRALERTAELALAALEDRRSLAERGLATAESVAAMQRDMIGLQGKIGALEASIAETRLQLAQSELDRLRAATARREEAQDRMRDLEFRLRDLEAERSALLERLRGLVLRAPQGGVVLGLLPVVPGSVIAPRTAVMQIVPLGQPDRVSLRIRPSDVHRLHPGQAVRVRLRVSDRPEPLDLDARLVRISATTLDDPRSGQGYYQAEISLSETRASPPPGGRNTAPQILPGTPVKVFIATGRQPVWVYLADPFMRYLSRAMREG